MIEPDDSSDPTAASPLSDRPSRTIGKRRSPDLAERSRGIADGGAGPTPEEIEWIRSMSQYRTRVPKGVFRYRSHEEANADWERWHVELVAETVYRREGTDER